MSLASRAYKILCSRYRDVLYRERALPRAKASRSSIASLASRSDHFAPFERLEPRVLLTAVTSVEPLEGSHSAVVATNVSATFDQTLFYPVRMLATGTGSVSRGLNGVIGFSHSSAVLYSRHSHT